MSSVGLAYDLRECNGCGMLYDHEFADWFDTLCEECKTRQDSTDSERSGGGR